MPAFRRDMDLCLGGGPGESRPVRTAHYSPLLHNAILAIGCCLYRGDRIHSSFPKIRSLYMGEENGTEADPADRAADAFAAKAKECFDVECERPMLSTVNGLLLMASFRSCRAQPNLGRTYIAGIKSCGLANDEHAPDVYFGCAVRTSSTVRQLFSPCRSEADDLRM